MDEESVTAFILKNAHSNIPYKNISALVEKKYGIYKSPNAIRKKLKAEGMPSRRGPTTHNRNEIKTAIRLLLPDLPHTVGYRNMTDILRQNNMHVRRDTVMRLMKEVDPISVEIRRRRRIKRKVYRSFGPNHIWHIDGYDKLKPFGFAIHGCIDGYSRKIMWLSVGPSNNNPSIVAYNYVQRVNEVKGCPLILQADPGTENCVVGAIQCVLRSNSVDCFAGINSFRVVKSKINQRIEAWWSMLRRQVSDWWINYFRDLVVFGGFRRGNKDDIHCARYCFMPVIRKELGLLIERWNNHYIAMSRSAECPNGRPNVLYEVPEQKGDIDCLQQVESDDIVFAFSLCEIPSRSGSLEFDYLAESEFRKMGWVDAVHYQEAIKQYFHLRE